MKFNYYYGSEADQFSFIKIPKILLIDERFKVLSLQSKMLYGMLLDRMGLSRKNNWIDAENKVYIIYKITQIQQDFGFSKRKAMDYLNELEDFGLVEKKKRGFGLPSILYVKSFMALVDALEEEEEEKKLENDTINDAENDRSRGVEIDTSRGAEIDTTRGAEIDTSRGAEIDTSEVRKSTPLISKTKYNKTNKSNTKCIKTNLIYSILDNNKNKKQEKEERKDEKKNFDTYIDCVKNKIDYDILVKNNKDEKYVLNEIVKLIAEVLMCEGDTMLIASNKYPLDLVKNKFLKLDYTHVQYVLEGFANNTTKINNIRKYMLASLFNAESTVESYYTARANHDLYGGIL